MEHLNLNLLTNVLKISKLLPQVLRKKRFTEQKFASEFPIFDSKIPRKMTNSL